MYTEGRPCAVPVVAVSTVPSRGEDRTRPMSSPMTWSAHLHQQQLFMMHPVQPSDGTALHYYDAPCTTKPSVHYTVTLLVII